MTGVSPSVSATPAPVYLPGAEAALVALTIATVLGFSRVFDRASFLPPMLAVGIVAHLVLVLGRRRGWGVPLTAAVSVPVAAIVCGWLVFPSTTLAGLPTGETLAAVDEALRSAWEQFGSILAPAPPEPGFVVASCVALFFAAFLADWAAFRLWSSFEAVVPASTLFLFCALLGAEHKLVSAAGFLTALLVFLLLHRVARQESGSGWLVGETGPDGPVVAGGRRSGPVLVGVSLVAVAVLAGALIGPHIPGAGAPPVLTWRTNSQGPGERKAVSPLVRIRDRLLNQPNVLLFTVRSDEEAYWRLTSLETFDGDIWKSTAHYGVAEGELPGEVAEGETDLLDQTFTVSNLAMIWAPAAYRPVKVVDSKVGLNYNEDSSTLIVEPNASLEGARYTIQSSYTQPTAEALRSVRASDIPQDIKDRYLGLPEDFSPKARQTAIEKTQGLGPFDKAKALQNFFRNDGFRYDTTFPLGHNEDAIDAFLSQRRGFCEQFAGTYAAMARSVGLPARVAVGFTPGVVRNPSGPKEYEVTGRQTHAWPEVYLGRYGWVMFEPTPNRGARNARWTDVAAAQDIGPEPAATPGVTAPTGSVPASTAPVEVNPAPPTTMAVAESTTTVPATAEPGSETRSSLFWQLVIAVLMILVGVLVLVVGMAALASAYLAVLSRVRNRRRRERRAWATNASRRVLVAWQECLEALHPLGLVPQRTESHDEFARRVAPRLGDAGPDLSALAEAVNHADYAFDLVDDDVVADAERSAVTVIEAATRLTTPMQKWLSRLDPRPLVGGGGQREPQHTISM